MQLNQRLNIKHSQSIVMTPQLRQAIKVTSIFKFRIK